MRQKAQKKAQYRPKTNKYPTFFTKKIAFFTPRKQSSNQKQQFYTLKKSKKEAISKYL